MATKCSTNSTTLIRIERIDLLIKLVADQKGLQSDSVDETVRRVNGWLERNRHASALAEATPAVAEAAA